MRYDFKGKVKKRVFRYAHGDTEIGIETHFDTLGNITKTIDHRQAANYPICFKEALLIIGKKMGKQDSIFALTRGKEIHRGDTLYFWEVYVKNPDIEKKDWTKHGKSWAYKINAATGRLIKKTRVISAP